MKIAVVDDLYEDRTKVSDYLRAYFFDHCKKLPLHIKVFENGQTFLQDFSCDQYDIIFLDYYLPDVTGIDLAKTIRQVDTRVVLIFMTVSQDFAINSYKVKASGYLLKPFDYEELSESISILDLQKIEDQQYIEFINGSESFPILLKDIIYCDVSGHYTYIYTSTLGTKRFRMSFSDVVHQLEPYPEFLVCYKGCMINMKQVVRMEESTFRMTNGERIPFRKKEQSKMLQIYSDFLFRSVRNGKL